MSFTNPTFSAINSLMDFVRREADGSIWDNVTYRTYNLEARTGEKAFKDALRLLKQTRFEGVRDILACQGLATDPGQMVRWLIWRRLDTGYNRKWPFRAGAKPLPSDDACPHSPHSLTEP